MRVSALASRNLSKNNSILIVSPVDVSVCNLAFNFSLQLHSSFFPPSPNNFFSFPLFFLLFFTVNTISAIYCISLHLTFYWRYNRPSYIFFSIGILLKRLVRHLLTTRRIRYPIAETLHTLLRQVD